jgi:cellulose biosynthesis protein BcsQ
VRTATICRPRTKRETTDAWREFVVTKAIAFFNNKGGVGKTTLACNYAAYEASQQKPVLLFDLDPQCNSTQLLLEDDQWEDIYEESEDSESKTIMGVLRHFRAGESVLDTDSASNIVTSRRFGVDVLPGHPGLSIFEDLLSEAWGDMRSGRAAGARMSMWLRNLRAHYGDSYAIIVVDVSPSLGAINRSALVGSDAFLTPMATDLFSLYALDNITIWLKRWLAEYEHGRPEAQAELDAIHYDLVLPRPLPIENGFIGYTTQQYVTRSAGGEVRQTEAYERHRREIPERARALGEMSRFSHDIDLGTIPNMFSMIPLAQSRHAPIAALEKDDGLRGAQFSQQERYAMQLQEVFARISDRLAEI